MGSHRPLRGEPDASLQGELDNELYDLARNAKRHGQAEAIMRIRALAEIGELLPTNALLELTYTLAMSRYHIGSDQGGADHQHDQPQEPLRLSRR